jgi:hypothetical protein
MTKIRRTALAAIAALTVGGALAVPAMAEAQTTPTTLSIQAESGGFFGHVQSSKQSCELSRTVKLHQHNGGLIGADLAQPNGPDSMWQIKTDRSGHFYANVQAKGLCAAATSRLVRSFQWIAGSRLGDFAPDARLGSWR